jgi:preprotein translocase subunit Sss1
VSYNRKEQLTLRQELAKSKQFLPLIRHPSLLLIEEVTKFLAKSKQFLLLKRHPSLLLIEEVSQLLAKSKHFLLLRRHPSLLLIEPRLVGHHYIRKQTQIT